MIYAIRAGDSGPIKFGVANDTKRRLSSLQTGNHEPLRLIAEADVHAQAEKLIHRYLRDECERGEWFRPTPKTMEMVDVIRAQAGSEEHVITNFVWERDLRTIIWYRHNLGADFDVFQDEVDRALAEGIEVRRIAAGRAS